MAAAPPREEGLRTFHLFVLGLSGIAMSLSSLNLNLLSYALPELREPWQLETWHLAAPLVAAAIGGIAGAALSGQLADRFGRRAVFQISVATFATASLISAAAPNLLTLALTQVLTGLGVNGMSPAVTSLVAEVAPPRARGRMIAVLESFWVLGGLLAAAIAFVLIPILGWRGAMAFGGIAAVYAVVLGPLVPESPRFLLARGRLADALAERERIERRWRVAIPLPTVALPWGPPPSAADRFRELWSPAYRRRTLCLWSLWFAQVFSYRGIFSWLPFFLVVAGQTEGDARAQLIFINLAQLPGTIGAALLVDRIGRKPIIVFGLGTCAVATAGFGLISADPLSAAVVAGVIGATNLGAYAVTLVYTPELYPTRARGTGVGMASSFGRLAAVVAPISVGALFAVGGGSLVPVFGLFAAVLAVGAVSVGVLGQETRGEPLEELSR